MIARVRRTPDHEKGVLDASHPFPRRWTPGGPGCRACPSGRLRRGLDQRVEQADDHHRLHQFQEQAIVSNIWADVLKRPATASGRARSRYPLHRCPAIEKGQIDLEPDYAASLLGFLHGGTPPAAATTQHRHPGRPESARQLRRDGAARHQALDTNVFTVTKATASKDHLTTISSLKPYASNITLGGPPERLDLRVV